MFRPEMDATELRLLVADLSDAPNRVQRGSQRALDYGADIVARSMRKIVAGHRYLPHLPNTVSHEPIGLWEREIGMEKGRKQGKLAHIMAYGSVNNAPVFDHNVALTANIPKIQNRFAEVAEQSVLGEES